MDDHEAAEDLTTSFCPNLNCREFNDFLQNISKREVKKFDLVPGVRQDLWNFTKDFTKNVLPQDIGSKLSSSTAGRAFWFDGTVKQLTSAAIDRKKLNFNKVVDEVYGREDDEDDKSPLGDLPEEERAATLQQIKNKIWEIMYDKINNNLFLYGFPNKILINLADDILKARQGTKLFGYKRSLIGRPPGRGGADARRWGFRRKQDAVVSPWAAGFFQHRNTHDIYISTSGGPRHQLLLTFLYTCIAIRKSPEKQIIWDPEGKARLKKAIFYLIRKNLFNLFGQGDAATAAVDLLFADPAVRVGQADTMSKALFNLCIRRAWRPWRRASGRERRRWSYEATDGDIDYVLNNPPQNLPWGRRARDAGMITHEEREDFKKKMPEIIYIINCFKCFSGFFPLEDLSDLILPRPVHRPTEDGDDEMEVFCDVEEFTLQLTLPRTPRPPWASFNEEIHFINNKTYSDNFWARQREQDRDGGAAGGEGAGDEGAGDGAAPPPVNYNVKNQFIPFKHFNKGEVMCHNGSTCAEPKLFDYLIREQIVPRPPRLHDQTIPAQTNVDKPHIFGAFWINEKVNREFCPQTKTDEKPPRKIYILAFMSYMKEAYIKHKDDFTPLKINAHEQRGAVDVDEQVFPNIQLPNALQYIMAPCSGCKMNYEDIMTRNHGEWNSKYCEESLNFEKGAQMSSAMVPPFCGGGKKSRKKRRKRRGGRRKKRTRKKRKKRKTKRRKRRNKKNR